MPEFTVQAASKKKTLLLERPIGRIAARSFIETESTRVCGLAARSQSASVVPLNRAGEAPGP